MNVKDSTLDELVKNYEVQSKVANEDLSGWDPRTINGKITQKRVAADEVKKIEQEYSRNLSAISGTLLLHGGTNETLQKFVDAAQELNVPVVNTNDLYVRLAEPVERNVGNRREFNAHSILMLVSELASVGKELGFESIKAPTIKVPVRVETAADTVAEVRKVIRESSGDEIAKAFFETRVLKKALEQGFNKPGMAVVVVCANKEEAEGLSKVFLSGNNNVVDLTDVKVSPGFVSGLVLKAKKQSKVSGD